MRALVLADTHIRDSGSTRLPERVWEEVRGADVVLHAGDVVGASFLDELRATAPLHAVLGNNDTALIGVLTETVELDLEGVQVAMVHDSGPRAGREARMHRRFPSADIVVFGHSHIPWNEVGVAGQLLFNPGSPTQRRGRPYRTFGLLEIDAGTVRAEIVRAD
jgi:putative phosphoesterase